VVSRVLCSCSGGGMGCWGVVLCYVCCLVMCPVLCVCRAVLSCALWGQVRDGKKVTDVMNGSLSLVDSRE